MEPTTSKSAISQRMARVRSVDTGAETELRRALWRRGLRYRVAPADVPGKPDIVFPGARLAVFVDGDYWHGNQWRMRGLATLEEQFKQTGDRGYWLTKLRRNMARDCAVTSKLQADGWTVARFWESEVLRDVDSCAELVECAARNETSSAPCMADQALPKKTVAEFFAGIGLMRMGLERQGWTVAFANDIDPRKQEMYEAHFGPQRSHFLLEDVHNVTPEMIPDVTLATASFPCTDLSLAGARVGLNGKQSSAFWGFARVLEGMHPKRRPPLVLIENVTGLLTSHGGNDLREVLQTLNRLGYSVDAFVLDAAWFVPQSRQRLFVVGANVPPTGVLQDMESQQRPRALCDFINANPAISWSMRPLPSIERRATSLEDVVEGISDDSPLWWSPERVEYLLRQMSDRHRIVADYMVSASKWSYGTVFRRMRNGKSTAELRADGIAGCLRTPKGGSAKQILLRAGFGRVSARLLTPRENARLMGADDYVIETQTADQALFGFGDAVCVPAVEWVARHYLDPMVNELLRGRLYFPVTGGRSEM